MFPTLFNQIPEETENREEFEEETNSTSGDLDQFGILPFILKFCEVTNHTFEDALNYNITTLFHIVSYEVILSRKQAEEIKKLLKRHR